MRTTVSDVPVGLYRLSRMEYDRAVEAGAFEPDARLELIDGNLHAMTPEGSRHALGIDKVAESLRSAFGTEFYVRPQHPMAADDHSEPQPDMAVVHGPKDDYRDAHPMSAPIVEVSRESLRYDRTLKQRLHARSGIPEYWILALLENRLEIYRNPAGDGYQSVTPHEAGHKVTPLAPRCQIVVDDLLP